MQNTSFLIVVFTRFSALIKADQQLEKIVRIARQLAVYRTDPRSLPDRMNNTKEIGVIECPSLTYGLRDHGAPPLGIALVTRPR